MPQNSSVREISAADAKGSFSFAEFGLGGDINKDLTALHLEAIRRCNNAIAWYCAARKRKRWVATPTRFATILFFGLAGAMPLLTNAKILPPHATLTCGNWYSASIDLTQLGYVFAAFATALIGFDKFFGFSSGWTRYMVAEVNLRKAAAEFETSWAIASTCLDEDPEEKKCGRNRVTLVEAFLAKANDIVSNETLQWVTEFQNAIGLFDKNFNSARDEKSSASANTSSKKTDAQHPDTHEKGEGASGSENAEQDQGER